MGLVPSLFFDQGQARVEVMEIMATSFKRSHAHTAALSAPNPEVGHRRLMPPAETHGYSGECLGQFLVGFLLLSPESWCTAAFVFAIQVCVCTVLCKFWWLCDGFMATSSRGLISYAGRLYPESLSLQQSTAGLYLHRRHSTTVLDQSLWVLCILLHMSFV